MKWQSLFLSVALVAPYANALIRFPCSQLVTQRFDPLVTPGRISPHLHQIVGGNAFNISMDINEDLPNTATCTTCRFKEDLSNYWTAVLFFKHQNGSLIRVPQFANTGTGSPNGGMTVYYIQPPNSKFTVFPKGFRMITGDPFARNNSYMAKSDSKYWALSFRCFGANFGQSDGSANSPPGAGSFDTVDLPKKSCGGGIRAQIFFPSCWDGKTLNPPDHHSHMAYPLGNVPAASGLILWSGGTCPSTHPVRTPLLFYETMWDTNKFKDMWPKDGSQPFVYSMGDPTGYGQHGDYVFGWKDQSLQKAMDSCTDINGVPSSCKVLTTLSDADINKCVQKSQIAEKTEGYLSALPGCNPIQAGPGPASMIEGCNAPSQTGPAGTDPTPTSPSGNPDPVPTSVYTPPPVPTSVYIPPPSPTSVYVPDPAPTAPAGPMQTHYGQCGGSGYNGPTSCESPFTCKFSNDYYSQCL